MAGDPHDVRYDELSASCRRVRSRHLVAAGAGDFPHRYRKADEPVETTSDLPGDPGLRDRLRHGSDGQHEAVLAWLIDGAVAWFRGDRVMPEHPRSVVQATHMWRRSSDLLLRYLGDNVIFDGEAHVMAKELYDDFTEWLSGNGHTVWSDQNFSARLSQHPEVAANGVVKKPGVRKSRPGLSRRTGPGRVVVVPKQYIAWIGVSSAPATMNSIRQLTSADRGCVSRCEGVGMGFFTKQWWGVWGCPFAPSHRSSLPQVDAGWLEEVEVTTKNHNTFREHRNPTALVAREVSRQRD